MDIPKEKIRIILTDKLGEDREANKNDIRFPLYKECYTEALNAILENAYNYDREKKLNAAYKCTDYNYNNVNNIIAFLGGRGSGKTTAVTEFCSILENFNSREKDYWVKSLHLSDVVEKFDCSSCRFTILKPIDASVLEEKENIVELIWSDMYRIVENEVKFSNDNGEKDELKRRLVKEFDDVYKNYSGVNSRKRDEIAGETVLLKLKNMSSSLKTRENFEKLLEDFFRLRNRDECEKHFLVVTIDDLDLNITDGFDMLEQIHKYLSHPQIIVLLAADFEQISMLCEAHFINGMKVGNAERDSWIIKHTDKLGGDYLSKVIPVYNRVYLPDSKMITQKASIIEAEQNFSVKEFIMYKLADKLSIYYDGNGLKRHFCLPGTVRELVAYNDFLDSFRTIDWNELEEYEKKGVQDVALRSTYMQRYDQNHERFNRDIVERMVYRILNAPQRTIFKLIWERSIERRAKYAVNFLGNWLAGNPVTDIVEGLGNSYSYSDLLECIHKLGRERYDDKVLIHCVLASFTSEMTREYCSMLYNTDAGEQEKSRERLENFVGDTFCGKWLLDMLPEINMKSGVSWKIAIPKRIELSKIEFRIPINQNDEDIDSTLNGVMTIFKERKIAAILGCLLLFINRYYGHKGDKPDAGLKFEIKPKKDLGNEGSKEQKEEESGSHLKIVFDTPFASFDIMAFMGSLDNCREIIENINRQILNGLIKCMKDYSEEKWSSQYEVKIKQEIECQIPYSNMYGNKVTFPFYNLDLSYNVLKRVKRDCKEQLNSTIKADDLYTTMQLVFGFVAEELWKEDEFYRKKKGRKTTFANDFVNSWFIQFFGIKYFNSDRGDDFSEVEGKLPTDFSEKLIIVLTSIYVALPPEDDAS